MRLEKKREQWVLLTLFMFIHRVQYGVQAAPVCGYGRFSVRKEILVDGNMEQAHSLVKQIQTGMVVCVASFNALVVFLLYPQLHWQINKTMSDFIVDFSSKTPT